MMILANHVKYSKTVLINAWNWILDSETGGLAVCFYFIFYFIAKSVQ